MDETQRQLLLKACSGVKRAQALLLLQRLKSGHTISRANMAFLDEIRQEAEQENAPEIQAHPKYGFLPQWAKNKVEGATLIGWNRGHFAMWRRKKPDEAPVERANGTENLWEWHDFIQKFGLSKDEENDDPQTARQKAEGRKSSAQAAILEERLRRLQGETIPTSVVSRNYTLAALQLKNKLTALGNNLAPKLRTISDELKIKELIDEAVWEALDPFSKSPHNGFECPACKHEVRLSHEGATNR